METFKKRYVAETKAAVAARNSAGDANVYYVNTSGWLTDNVDYEDGNGHPNEPGHIKIANGWPRSSPRRSAPARSESAMRATVQLILALAMGRRARRQPATATPPTRTSSFTGRWDTDAPTAYTPYWAGAYFRTGFTGKDGQAQAARHHRPVLQHRRRRRSSTTNVSGTVNLTPTPLAAGNHTLRVSYRVVAGLVSR